MLLMLWMLLMSSNAVDADGADEPQPVRSGLSRRGWAETLFARAFYPTAIIAERRLYTCALGEADGDGDGQRSREIRSDDTNVWQGEVGPHLGSCPQTTPRSAGKNTATPTLENDICIADVIDFLSSRWKSSFPSATFACTEAKGAAELLLHRGSPTLLPSRIIGTKDLRSAFQENTARRRTRTLTLFLAPLHVD